MASFPQPPHAPVLRRHRELTLQTFYPGLVHMPNELHWVETGETQHAGQTPNTFFDRIAQLAADCEARGDAKLAALSHLLANFGCYCENGGDGDCVTCSIEALFYEELHP